MARREPARLLAPGAPMDDRLRSGPGFLLVMELQTPGQSRQLVVLATANAPRVRPHGVEVLVGALPVGGWIRFGVGETAANAASPATTVATRTVGTRLGSRSQGAFAGGASECQRCGCDEAEQSLF